MQIKLCTCGFANREDAQTCLACGAPLDSLNSLDSPDAPSEGAGPLVEPATSDSTQTATEPTPTTQNTQASEPHLTLTNVVSSGQEPLVVPAPGGIIGRAGDFSPELFSPRVSAVHAQLTYDAGSWSITHLGRNRSYLLRGDVWTELPKEHAIELRDQDRLRLADMYFDVAIAPDANASTSDGATESSELPEQLEQPEQPESSASSETQPTAWFVTCPVCDTRYRVDSADERITECTVCVDMLDKRKIAGVSARPIACSNTTPDAPPNPQAK